jgi:hypothetical protein
MSIIVQWCVCCAIGCWALAYLAIKYLVRKETPGAACGKCKACATSAKLAQLAGEDAAGVRKRLPLRRA